VRENEQCQAALLSSSARRTGLLAIVPREPSDAYL